MNKMKCYHLPYDLAFKLYGNKDFKEYLSFNLLEQFRKILR